MATPQETLFAIVGKLAGLLVETIEDAAKPIADMEAATPNRTVRRIHKHALVAMAAEQIWNNAGRELLTSSLSDSGLDLDSIGVSEDELFSMFSFGVRIALDEQLEKRVPAVLDPLPWRRAGGSDGATLSLPPAPCGEASNYVLAVDEGTGEVLYVCGDSDDNFGLSWVVSEAGFEARNRIPLTLRGLPAQSFQGFYDPSRKGIACWTLVDGTARGVLLDSSGANPIEHAGTVPEGPLHCGVEFGAAFGFDRRRNVTVCYGREAIHELDQAGVWTRVADIPEPLRPTTCFSGNEAAVFHRGRNQLLVCWAEWDDTKYRMVWWDGSAAVEADDRGLPERAFLRHGGPLCEHEDGIMWLGGAGVSPHVLGSAWAPLADTVTGEPPPKISEARGCRSEKGCVLGPGSYDMDAGERKRLHVFYHYEDGVYRREGERRVGTGTATRPRRLSATKGGLWAVDADWTTRHRPTDAAWQTVSGACTERDPLIALASTGDALWGVARGGAVYVWDGSEWDERASRSIVFGDWEPLVAAEPSGRLVAWGGHDGHSRYRCDDTLVFEQGAWRMVADAGSPGGASPRPRVGHALYWDSFFGAVTAYGDGGIAILEGDRWRSLCADSFASKVHRSERVIVHDAMSGETLGVDLHELRVARIDAAGETVVADVAEAGATVDLRPAEMTERPLSCDWVYDPVEQALSLFVDDELEEEYILDLDAAIVHAKRESARSAEVRAAREEAPTRRSSRRQRREPPDEAPAPHLHHHCDPVTWQRFGPPRPAADIEPPPFRERRDYALCFDSTAERVAFVRPLSSDWGETWRWNGQGWHCAQPQPIDTPSTGQRFRAVDDPTRGGVVCWTTDSEYDADRKAFGILSAGDVVSMVKTRGETPALSQAERDLNQELLFAFDAKRAVTVAVSSRGQWELDATGVWSRVRSWDEGNPLAQKWTEQNMADAGWDVLSGGIILWFPGDDDQLHFVSVGAEGLAEITLDGLPDDIYRPYSTAPIIAALGERGVRLYAGPARGWFTLRDGTWHQTSAIEGAPPAARFCQAAYDAKRKMIMFGPGAYAGSADDSTYEQHVFYEFVDSAWRRHGVLQPTRPRPFHIESLAVQGEQMVGLNRTNELFVWRDDAAWVEAPDAAWFAWTEIVVVGCRDRDGRLAGMTTGGGVYHLVDGKWQARTIDRTAFGADARYEVTGAYDPTTDAWLAYDLDSCDKRSNTLLLVGDTWQILDADAKIQPKPYDDSVGSGEFVVAHDGFWHRFLRVHRESIAALDDGLWRVIPASPKSAGFDDPGLRVVHDATTAETLLIDFEKRQIGRLDYQAITFMTRFELPVDFVDADPNRWGSSFPYTRKSPYDPDKRRLLLFDPNDHFGNYELELGSVFDAAAALGPRAAWPAK